METPALKTFRLHVKTLTGVNAISQEDNDLLLHLGEEIAREANRLEREVVFHTAVGDAMEHEERDLYRRWYEKMRDEVAKFEENPQYEEHVYAAEMSKHFRLAEEEREKLGDTHGRLKASIVDRHLTFKRRRKEAKEALYTE